MMLAATRDAMSNYNKHKILCMNLDSSFYDDKNLEQAYWKKSDLQWSMDAA
jgi:hypothetical protein